jgi:predicted PurR-regulated permease PerM
MDMAHTDSTHTQGWRLSGVVIAVAVIAALYFARSILIPVALAGLLTFLLAPWVARIEARTGNRVIAVAIVSVLAVCLAAGIGLLVGHQFVSLAEKLPEYRATLLTKVRSVRQSADSTVSKASETIQAIGAEFSKKPGSDSEAAATPAATDAVSSETGSSITTGVSLLSYLAIPVIQLAASTAIVVVLLVLMLIARQDIRDRVIRLAGLGNIGLTTQALEEAGDRVGRYLGANLLINAVYAVGVSAGLWMLEVPNAAMCGLMAGILRFVPMLGSWLGAVIPVALSIAVFDDWWHLALVITLIATLEIVNNIALEPWLYGNSTGLSSLGVVLAIIFWTWVWGPIGLVLAVPVTVCLVAFSRQIPQLGALSILLGDEQVLTDALRFYQRLLCNNESDAAAILAAAPADSDIPGVLDDVIIPSLTAARLDLERGLISQGQADRITRASRELVSDWLDERSVASSGATASTQAVLCIPASDEFDATAGAILATLLVRRGVQCTATSSHSLLSEALTVAQDSGIAIVVLSALQPSSETHVRRLCKSIRQRVPAARLVVGAWGDLEAGSDERLADARVGTLRQACATVISLAGTDQPAVEPRAEEAVDSRR